MADNFVDQLTTLPGATAVERRPDGLWMIAPTLDVQAMARKMNEAGAMLSTISAAVLAEDETEIIYHYWLDHEAVNIKAHTQQNAIPSIALIVRAADWIEREIHDLYNVEFQGHPNLVRLVRPPQLANGLFREPGGAAGKN